MTSFSFHVPSEVLTTHYSLLRDPEPWSTEYYLVSTLFPVKVKSYPLILLHRLVGGFVDPGSVVLWVNDKPFLSGA